jgi:hypothetical protein
MTCKKIGRFFHNDNNALVDKFKKLDIDRKDKATNDMMSKSNHLYEKMKTKDRFYQRRLERKILTFSSN